MPFTWSDAWLLNSVVMLGEEGGDLSAVIGAGDAVNHAIFTLEELRSGFARLEAAGLVAKQGTGYAATGDGLACGRTRGSWLANIERLARRLEHRPCPDVPPRAANRPTAAEYEAACAAYLAAMRRS